MSTDPTTRITRLLTLVPYFQSHPGTAKADAARDLGTSVAQLEKDLELLWMCGLPGHAGGDLIDLSFAGDTVEVSDSQGMDRPLRLTRDEATAILLALGLMTDRQSNSTPSAARTAMAKIEQAAGQDVAAASTVTLAPSPADDTEDTEDIAAAVSSGVDRHKAMRIRYYSAARDAVTERVVDPIREQVVGGRRYLEAWCRSAEANRFFLYERIDAVTVLDEAAAVPDSPAARPADALADFTAPDSALPTARLVVAADSRWVPDYYPMTQTRDVGDGSVEVTLRYSTEAWLVRMLAGFGGHVRLARRSPSDADGPGTPSSARVHEWCTAALAAYDAAARELGDGR